MLQQKYPQLAISGDNYPPPSWRLQLSQIIGLAKMAVILCVVSGFNPFPIVAGLPDEQTPQWFKWLLENKLYACLMIFFLCNAVETHLVSTGAFEISLDEMPVWSKIESGRIPQPPELFQIIDNHFKLNTGENPNVDTFRDEL